MEPFAGEVLSFDGREIYLHVHLVIEMITSRRIDAMYDYLIVGAGLFGAVFAREAVKAGKKVLVIDKRPNISGNVYTEKMEGIQGAHIFHTNNKKVWDYLQIMLNLTGLRIAR